MTARYFCDVCTTEVQNPATQPEFKTTVVLTDPPEGHTDRRTVDLKITRSIDGAWNAGHLCNRCLSAALLEVVLRLSPEVYANVDDLGSAMTEAREALAAARAELKAASDRLASSAAEARYGR